jgi:hypothetical protein
MAIKKTIEIDVNSLQAVGGLDNLDKALRQVDKSAKSVDATFEEVYGDLQPLTARMGEAEDRLYELALAGQTATKEYKDLLATVGNYRKTQIQTDLAVDAAATTLDTKLGGALQGAISGFAGVQGAMSLAGMQSQALEETLVKVQGAMALAEGVRGVRESAASFKALGTSAKAALSGIRTGIAATGIGVLLIALGAVVAYWDDIKEAVNGVSAEQTALNEKTQANLDAEQKKLDTIGSQDNVLKLQGKSEKDILKMKIAQTDQVIKATENQIVQNDITAKAQIEAAKRNKEILKGTLEFLSIPFQAVLKTIDSIGSAIGKDFGLSAGFSKILDKGASLIFDPEAEKAAAEATRKESLKTIEKLKNDKAGMQLSLQGIDKQASTDAAAKRKEANDKEIQDAKDRSDALERIRQGEIDTQAERRAEELFQVQEQYRLLIEEATKYGQDTTALKEAQRTKEKELTDRFAAEDAEKKLAEDEKAKAEAQKKLEDEKLLSEEKIRIAQAEAEAKKAIQDASFDVASQGINLIKGLFEKNKGIQKGAMIAESALGIAKIIVNTQTANAVAAASPLNAVDPTYGIRARIINTVSAGIGIAANIAATAKGLAALGGGGAPSGGNVGGGGGGQAAAPAPQFNVVGNTGINQVAATLGQQQPVQAFVVANQVTSQQALDRSIVNNASLG